MKINHKNGVAQSNHCLHIVWLVSIACVSLTGCSSPDGDWHSAIEQNTKTGYESFLKKYPENPHAKEAGERLETISFDAAKASRKVEALKQFLAEHPKGAHAADANKEIAAMTPIRGRMFRVMIDSGVNSRGVSVGSDIVYLELLDKSRKYEVELTPDTKYFGGDPDKFKLGDVYDIAGPIEKAKIEDGKPHLESDIEIIAATSVTLVGK